VPEGLVLKGNVLSTFGVPQVQIALRPEWLLPEGIDELLPPDATRLEALRRRILDLFAGHGFDLVAPPLVESLGSLLSGTGTDLAAETFTLTDPRTGQLLGIRADITPQVARIDALRLRRPVPTRLCYAGPTLHTVAAGHGASRGPLQVGAEIYGHAGIESDVEVVSLMERMLAAAGVTDLVLEVGHVGVCRALFTAAGLAPEMEARLQGVLARKAGDALAGLLDQLPGLAAGIKGWLLALPGLNGGPEVLAEAAGLLANAPPTVAPAQSQALGRALAEVAAFRDALASQCPGLAIHYDLGEIRGYGYHTGLLFAAYVADRGHALARGGRYDGIGGRFGAARPATGMSADLLGLLPYWRDEATPARILAPAAGDPALDRAVAALRAAGRVVVRALPGAEAAAQAMGCAEELVHLEGQWHPRPVAAIAP
jgi:ATP phosphoribosyltransferase regulatory subunit